MTHLADLLRRLLSIPSKPRPPIDYGDGLQLLPEQAPDRDDETGLLIPEWAARKWQTWESSTVFLISNDQRHACPSCVMVSRVETYRYMTHAHSVLAARARWRRHLTKGESKLKALGPCRCGHRVNPGQAAADAHSELSRYRI